jgi:hypothetical protein
MRMQSRLQNTTRSLAGSAFLAILLLGTGCSTGGQQRPASGELREDAGVAVLEIRPGMQADAFDAAREALMSYRFAIDRVDARRGVLTTHPKRTAGLLSPWDREQSSVGQEWEDLINEQQRVVRVEFDQDDAGVHTARVSVEVLRTHRPNWRVQSESVRLSTHARQRNAEGVLEPATWSEVVGLDAALARRIADSIGQRLTDAADVP